jgi:hypothetical protein
MTDKTDKSKTPSHVDLPLGWTCERVEWMEDAIAIRAIRGASVTVCYVRRAFELGGCMPRPKRGDAKPAGPGWKRRLDAAAIEALKAAL